MLWVGMLIGAGAGALVGWLIARRTAAPEQSARGGRTVAGSLLGAIGGMLVGIAVTAGGGQASDESLTVEQFRQKVLEAEGPVLVDFYADWCAPCRELEPTIQELAQQYAGRVGVHRVDVDEQQTLAREYNIRYIPDVILFLNGEQFGRWSGVKDKSVYQAAIEKALRAAEQSAPAATQPTTRTQPTRKETATMSDKQVTMKGKPLTLIGESVGPGDKAPDFTAVNTDLEDVRLADLTGKTLVLASVPSLDTSVCSTETKKFSDKAAELGDDVQIVTISMDLPFAQKRWCGAEGVDNVMTLSDHRAASFGESYGVLIEELRLLARAVFVVDADGKITYKQIVNEVSDEPDYDAVLQAVADARS